MKPVKTIDVQNWMSAELSQKVIKALGAGNAMFVGGCVRNALLGEAVTDIDMATTHPPERTVKLLENAGIKAIPTGIDHGTITAVLDKSTIEITTLRKDVETDGRHAEVAFSDSWVEDAERRDFTMNTLLADEKGNVFDPLEVGLKDLEARRVVFVGAPSKRIEEDYLRILRFFRFFAQYGAGEPDAAALKACQAAADKIPNLSKERITQEFFKILAVKDSTKILKLIFDHGVLKDFDFADYAPETLKHLCYFQNEYGLVSIAARLYVLAGGKDENIEMLKKGLLIPKVFQKDITAIQGVLALPDLSDDHAVKVAVYKFGRTATAQSLMIQLAQDRVKRAFAGNAFKIIQKWDVPNFPVSGEDLIQKGFKPGPGLGAELERLENEWIAGGF